MTSGPERTRGLLKLSALVLLLAIGILAIRHTPLGELFSRAGVVQGVELLRSEPLAPLIFVPLYAGAVALALPGTLATLVGGAVFGLWWGTLFNWMGAILGANIAYALSRFLGREGVADLLGERSKGWPALERLDASVRDHGLRGMLILRLIPIIPFNALNFGGGLVGMPWTSYFLATAVGILPGTFIYTMFADALLEGSTEASREAFLRLVLAGLLLVLLSFLPVLLKALKLKLPGGRETFQG